MTTPDRYTPDPRKYDQKHWLYEQYWGNLLSTYEIAEKVDVSADTIKRRLRELGIPRRNKGYKRGGNTSAFNGFYTGDENAQVDDKAEMKGVESERDATKLEWQKDARQNNLISDKAVLGD